MKFWQWNLVCRFMDLMLREAFHPNSIDQRYDLRRNAEYLNDEINYTATLKEFKKRNQIEERT